MLEALLFFLQIRQCHVSKVLKTEKQCYGRRFRTIIFIFKYCDKLWYQISANLILTMLCHTYQISICHACMANEGLSDCLPCMHGKVSFVRGCVIHAWPRV